MQLMAYKFFFFLGGGGGGGGGGGYQLMGRRREHFATATDHEVIQFVNSSYKILVAI